MRAGRRRLIFQDPVWTQCYPGFVGSSADLAAGNRPAVAARSVALLAQESGVRERIEWFAREKQWINEMHLALNRIPAPTFLEQKRAEWMVEQFRALGCDAKLDRAGNVVAYPDGDRQGPFIAVTAHLDTVLAPRSAEEITTAPDGR